MGFALIAGAATAITPCVLPVLPALLSASAVGGATAAGRDRPRARADLHDHDRRPGVGDRRRGSRRRRRCVRSASPCCSGFGLMLLWPRLAARVEAPLYAARSLRPARARRRLLVGRHRRWFARVSVRAVRGPDPRAVVSVSASQGSSARDPRDRPCLQAGSAVRAAAVCARRAPDRRAHPRGGRVDRRSARGRRRDDRHRGPDGGRLDVRFQTALADHFPSFLVNPTAAIEESDAVERRLADLRGEPTFRSNEVPGGATRASVRSEGSPLQPAGARRGARVHGQPALVQHGETGAHPEWPAWTRRADRLLDLHVHQLHPHAPGPAGVARALPGPRPFDRGRAHSRVRLREGRRQRGARDPQNDLRYAVAQDNEFGTWNAWGNQYWPAKYLIDSRGRVRYAHFGEGSYGETEAAIRSLLQEAGAKQARHPRCGCGRRQRHAACHTPETYLGSERAQGFLPGEPVAGERRYPGFRRRLPQDGFTLAGTVGRRARVGARGA